MKKYGSLIGVCLAGIASPAFAIPITVKVNTNGTFTPPTLEINEGDTVLFQGNGFSFTNTDGVVQIGSPTITHTLAQLCGTTMGGPMTSVVSGSELYGPRRKGISGIHVLAPQGNGFIERTTTTPVADCQAFFHPTDPNIEYLTVGNETPVAGTRYLLCKKQINHQPAAEGNEGLVGQVVQSVWNNPDIDGVVLRIRWSDFQHDSGSAVVTDWTNIDRETREAIKRGKIVSINVHAGEDTPLFIFNNYDRDPNTPGLQKLPESNVAPVLLHDYPSDPTIPDNCGQDFKLGSPADPNYLAKIKGLYQLIAAHFKQDARFFQSLGYVKVTGMNLFTGEARLPKRCLDPDAAPNPGTCVCNTDRWANATHRYTPTKLYTFYNEVENQIFTSFLGQKSLHYMLIQDGFPRVLDQNNYFRDPGHRGTDGIFGTADDGALGAGFPGSFEQTVNVLEYGRKGRFVLPGDPTALADNLAAGKLFVSQHSGLQKLPRDGGAGIDCDQIGSHVLAVDGAAKNYFSYFSGGLPPVIHDGDGCPNFWAAREGYRDQIIGFQTTNEIALPADVDSSLWNMTANSNSAYYEFYDDAAWRIGKVKGTGPAALVLATTGFYPLNNVANQKNLYRWGQQLHARREAIAAHLPTYPNAADPFPADYSHTFSAPLNVNQVGVYFFIDPARCLSAPTANSAYGRIMVHGL